MYPRVYPPLCYAVNGLARTLCGGNTGNSSVFALSWELLERRGKGIWCRLRDYSALRASPLRTRPSDVNSTG